MNLRALRLVPLAAILATAALRADVAAAADPAPLPAAASPDGTVAETAMIPAPRTKPQSATRSARWMRMRGQRR